VDFTCLVYFELDVFVIVVVNTHVHADHITGTGLIKRQIPTCKSIISKHTNAKADRYVDDGELIKFGNFSLECRATPGHTDCKSQLIAVLCNVFCVLAIADLSVGHTMDVLSPFISVFYHSD